MLDFHGLITSYVAYFSTWQPHENRVSKTWFITLINNRDHSQNISNQRRTQKKKKKERRTQAARRCATQARPRGARRPRPSSVRSIWVLLFLFFFWVLWYVLGKSPIWVSRFFHFFCVFQIVWETWDLHFFKIFLACKSSLRGSISR